MSGQTGARAASTHQSRQSAPVLSCGVPPRPCHPNEHPGTRPVLLPLPLSSSSLAPRTEVRGGRGRCGRLDYWLIVRFFDRLMVSRLSTLSSVWELSRICRSGGVRAWADSLVCCPAAPQGCPDGTAGEHRTHVPNLPSYRPPRSPGSSGRTRYGLRAGCTDKHGDVWGCQSPDVSGRCCRAAPRRTLHLPRQVLVDAAEALRQDAELLRVSTGRERGANRGGHLPLASELSEPGRC
jgi:hypothetical protein